MVPTNTVVPELAAQNDAELRALPMHSGAQDYRAVHRAFSRQLLAKFGEVVLSVARSLVHDHAHRWSGYEIILFHEGAFALVGEAELVELGRGINSWGSVDAFARLLAGPAWLRGQIPDELIHGLARSDDRWWRRAGLVSTVAPDMRSQGGKGDVPRTLAVCEMLVGDGDEMVVKAMSWAVRELVPHDPDAVRAFLAEHDGMLAARVKREVRNKLDTGLKNPRRSPT